LQVNVRKREKSYEYYFEVASMNGKRNRISKAGYNTRKEAFEEGYKAMNKLYAGVDYKPSKMSYADFLNLWIEKYALINLKYRTIETYVRIIKLHIVPKLGFYTMEQLNSAILNDFMISLYVEHNYSKNYLHNFLKIIKSSLRFAYEDMAIIPYNPADRVHVPKYDTPPHDVVHIFTNEEVSLILNRFKDSSSIYYGLLTAYFTGMRLSEIFALTWDDIDFEKKTININKNIVERNQEGTSHHKHVKGSTTCVWYFGTCKTQSSYRTVTMGDTLTNALKEFKQEQDENKELYGNAYLMHYKKEVINPYTNKVEYKVITAAKEIPVGCPVVNFVFVKPNGYYLGTNVVKYAMKIIHYELGIKCRFHDFRETHATRLIEQGADVKAVAKRLGHSNINTTYNIYVRVTEKMKENTADKFDEYADLNLKKEKEEK